MPQAAVQKRLHQLETPRAARWGVVMVPRPMTIDEWERIAIRMQAELLSASAVDRAEGAPPDHDLKKEPPMNHAQQHHPLTSRKST